jgi:hypothetical protein
MFVRRIVWPLVTLTSAVFSPAVAHAAAAPASASPAAAPPAGVEVVAPA